MDDNNIRQVLLDWMASWTGNNPNNLLSFYHPNCLYIDSFGKFNGHSQLKRYFTRLLASNPKWVWEMTKLYKHKTKNPNSIECTMEWSATIPLTLSKNQETTFHLTGIDLVVLEADSKLLTKNHVFFHADKEYQRYMQAINQLLSQKQNLKNLNRRSKL